MQTVKQKTKLGIRQQLECAFGSVQPVNVPPVSKRVHGIKTLLFYVYAFLPVLIKARKTLGGDTVLMHSIQVHHHN